MKEILVVFGTRPEAIKLCPLILEFERRKAFRVTVAVTGQHREMLKEVLDSFGIRPQYNLAIMRKGQTLSEVTAAVLEGVTNILVKQRFDCVATVRTVNGFRCTVRYCRYDHQSNDDHASDKQSDCF